MYTLSSRVKVANIFNVRKINKGAGAEMRKGYRLVLLVFFSSLDVLIE